MRKPLKLAALMFTTILIMGSPAPGSAAVVEQWGKINDKLGTIINLVEKENHAPASSWNPFKEDKKSIRKDIDELIDEAISLLNISSLSEIKAEISEYQGNIRNFETLITELKAKKLMAPQDVSAWKLWKKDMADYEEEIDDFTEKVAENKEKIETLKFELLQEIRATGLDLTPDQIDTLIYSATGDDDVELISVFNNVKAITVKLQDLTDESGEDIETARKYYGMYTVLLRILIALQEAYLSKIDNHYLPALDDLVGANQALTQKTRSLMAQSDSKHKAMYVSNLKAQALTAKTARLYRKCLLRNKTRVNDSVKRTRQEYQVAENTYSTVSTAYSLVTMIRESEKMFAALSDLQVPDLLTFENNEMKLEFHKITARMLAQED